MLKFGSKNPKRGSDIVGIGLTEKDIIEVLRQGKAFRFHVEELGMSQDVEVLIFLGETEADLKAWMVRRGLISSSTQEKFV